MVLTCIPLVLLLLSVVVVVVRLLLLLFLYIIFVVISFDLCFVLIELDVVCMCTIKRILDIIQLQLFTYCFMYVLCV